MPLDLECKNNLSFICRVFSWPGLEHQIYILPYCGASCDNEFKQESTCAPEMHSSSLHEMRNADAFCLPLAVWLWPMSTPPCIRSGPETHPSLPLKAYVFCRNAVLRLLKTENLKPFLCNNTHFSIMGLWKTTPPSYIPTSSSLNDNAPEQLRPL